MTNTKRLIRTDKGLGGFGLMSSPNSNRPGSSPSESSFDGLLVGYQPSSTPAERAAIRASLSLNLRETIETAAMKSSGAGPIELVDLPQGISTEQAIENLSRRAGVNYAEKNWIFQTQDISNDPEINNLWGMSGNEFGIRAELAWDKGILGSQDVYVGIIDEGYQYTHPDLSPNAGKNTIEKEGDGIDNDGNGLVDDVYGWDFSTSSRRSSGDNTVYDGTSDDHGTHVAGTIGAKGGNGQGVAGVNWNIKLLNAKFLGANGGSLANAVKAIDYFTTLKEKNRIPIVATNNSWGGGGFSQSLYDAIARANTQDILFIAAAGNGGSDGIGDNNDATANYPSNYDLPNVIAVASITSNGNLSNFSNYGATTVDLGAPGSGIYSTLPTDAYGSYSGTSMATPHVTGVAALLKTKYPVATGAQIKQAILDGGVTTDSLSGKTVSGRRLNTLGALNALDLALYGGTSGTPTVTLEATDAFASETGPDSGTFTLRRGGANLADQLEVQLSWSGSASPGSDYNGKVDTITFAANKQEVLITVTPVDDSESEGDESIILNINDNSAYSVIGSPTATVNIADNDNSLPTPSLDPITNFQGDFTAYGTAGQMFLDGTLNSGFGLGSYAQTLTSSNFNPNAGGNVIRVLDKDAKGNALSWFYSSKYTLNGVAGLAVFADLGPATNLSAGIVGAEDDLVAFISGWAYKGKASLGSASSVSWIKIDPVA